MTARGVLTIAGQVVGGYFGGPWGAAIGGAVGGAIGGEIDGPQQAQGPRLADTKLPSIGRGLPMAYLEGTQRLPLNPLWLSDVREVATTTNQGGKGSDSSTDVTSFSYEVDGLFWLTSNEIAGVSRIWSNGQLVWSVLSVEAAETSESISLWDELIVYTGAADQLPDPTYEAVKGVGSVPAYRQRGTIMLRGLTFPMPNLTAEVFTAGEPGSLGLLERFENELDDYTTVSGDPSDFQVFYDPSLPGNALFMPLTTHGAPGDQIERDWGPLTTARVRFKFRLETTGGDDDAGQVSFGDTGGRNFYFSPMREAAFDPDKRPWLTLTGAGGTGTIYLGSGALEVLTWYQATLVLSLTPGASSFTIHRAADSVLIASYTFPASPGPGPLYIDRLDFYRDSAPFDTTNATSFADFRTDGTPASIDTVLLSDVTQRQCIRAGLAAGQVDVTALAAIPVRGMAVTQTTPIRNVLQNLSDTFFFEAVESEFKVKFVLRGGAVGRTVLYQEMGATLGDSGDPFPMRRMNPIEVPAKAIVRFANALDDYQDGSETSDRLVDQGNGITVLELPIVLTPQEAMRIANRVVNDITNSRFQFGPIALDNDHVELEPTDVVEWTDSDGNTFRSRLVRLTAGGGVNEFEGVLDDADVVNTTAVTDVASYTYSVTVIAPAATAMEVLDIPILRDADDQSGLYVVAKGVTTPWPGAAVMRSSDDITYDEVARVTESGVFGVAQTALTSWTRGRVWDEVSTVRVSIGNGTASSSTHAAMLADQSINAWLIGDEVLQARNAVLVSAGVYDLSGFLRGARGTEHHSTGHVALERVVLLRPAGMRRLELDTARIGIEMFYRGVTFGRHLDTAFADSVTSMGIDITPFSPFDLRVSRDGSNNATLTWQRRTRRQVRTIGPLGISIPLGEASEAYEVDIHASDVDPTVVRTISATSATAPYTAAEQTSDGLTPGDPITASVYQMSEIVGRGTPLEATA